MVAGPQMVTKQLLTIRHCAVQSLSWSISPMRRLHSDVEHIGKHKISHLQQHLPDIITNQHHIAITTCPITGRTSFLAVSKAYKSRAPLLAQYPRSRRSSHNIQHLRFITTTMSSSNNEIILYDLPSKDPCRCWSLNPWKSTPLPPPDRSPSMPID